MNVKFTANISANNSLWQIAYLNYFERKHQLLIRLRIMMKCAASVIWVKNSNATKLWLHTVLKPNLQNLLLVFSIPWSNKNITTVILFTGKFTTLILRASSSTYFYMQINQCQACCFIVDCKSRVKVTIMDPCSEVTPFNLFQHPNKEEKWYHRIYITWVTKCLLNKKYHFTIGITSSSALVQRISQRKNRLHNPFQLHWTPYLWTSQQEYETHDVKHIIWNFKLTVSTSSADELTMFRFRLRSDTWEELTVKKYNTKKAKQKNTVPSRRKGIRCLTWDRNWILNKKTLSLESTRGNFISSMKNCSRRSKLYLSIGIISSVIFPQQYRIVT